MPPKSSFVVGEKVLCFHGPLLYEAKLLKKEIKDRKSRYFVHYSGWKKNWDEWVPENRVLKFNNANLQKQKELSQLQSKSKKSAKKEVAVTKDSGKKPETSASVQEKSSKKEVVVKRIPTKKPETPKPTPKPAEKNPESFPKTERKQLPKTDKPSPKVVESKIEDCLDKYDKKKIDFKDLLDQGLPIEIEEEIEIPTALEDFICEDYDLINNQKMIVRLPARFTVEYILASYVTDKVSDNEVPDPEKKRIREFANHIQDCFDVLLGKTCLYKFEKPQYLDIHENKSDRRKCEIYGGTHLLRMFCKMDELLKGCNPPGPELTETRKDVKEFIRYLSENMHFFNQKDYVEVSPEYH